MHADVDRDDSPSRQLLLEDVLCRRPTFRVFQYSHARFVFLSSTIRALFLCRDGPVSFTSALELNHDTTICTPLCSKQERVAPTVRA
jgi:hypothetical protein